MVWFGNDVHIYLPHIANFTTQFGQKAHPAPALKINCLPGTMPWEVNYEDLELVGYQCSQKVPFELFVG
jgi:thymidylate synthase